MSFAERYVSALNTSDLRDDERHHATEPLVASGLADVGSGELLGSLLCRAKYSDGTIHKEFEAGSINVVALHSEWEPAVIKRGESRGWMTVNFEWDIAAARATYRKIARVSLAHWLDGNCESCNGAKVTVDRRTCKCCSGTGRAAIDALAGWSRTW
ncbi:MAG: hypothetical protein WKG03_02915 [Telluria sp.]